MIAIDGPAGAGKSTTAREVARALGFGFVDSGAYYRAAALVALRRGFVDEGEVRAHALARSLAAARIEQPGAPLGGAVLLDGEDVTAELRGPAVSAVVGRVAAEPEVRKVMTARLREAALGRPLVMDGRDIGTVVFPRARLKIFLDASLEERARRRSAADRAEVPAESLDLRDRRDRSRETAPLVAAPDAVRILSDDLTLEEQVSRIVALYQARAPRDAS